MWKNILFIAFLCFSHFSNACKCYGSETIEQAFENSDIIFSGKVISLKLSNNYNKLRIEKVQSPLAFLNRKALNFPIKIVKLRLIKGFKGNSKNQIITIYTGANGGACGIDFILGKEYIVYSDECPSRLIDVKSSNIWTDICTRTELRDLKEEEILTKLSKNEYKEINFEFELPEKIPFHSIYINIKNINQKIVLNSNAYSSVKDSVWGKNDIDTTFEINEQQFQALYEKILLFTTMKEIRNPKREIVYLDSKFRLSYAENGIYKNYLVYAPEKKSENASLKLFYEICSQIITLGTLDPQKVLP